MPRHSGRIACLIVALTAAVSFAEVIELTNGSRIEGEILKDGAEIVVIDIGVDVLKIPTDRIKSRSASFDKPGAKAEVKKGDLYSVAKLPLKPVKELANEYGDGVVLVQTPGGLGSGFILNEEGFLITNFHVIEGETQISVEVYHQKGDQLERKTYKQVKIMAMNKFHDLALLKINDADAPKFSWVPLGDPDVLGVGERVFAIGSPLGLERTVTEGIVSTKTRQLQGELYMQTTAQINPGNSGGPLFNLRGEVVGVTNMKLAFGEGLGFAIPVSRVKYFLNHRDAYAYDNDNPSNPYRYLTPPSRLRKTAMASDK